MTESTSASHKCHFTIQVRNLAFHTLDRNGQIQRQVLISKGVRQSSVEGPLIFVACHDLVLHGIQGRREAAELSSISASSRATRSGDEAVVPVNEIAFVDDLLSFLIFVSWERAPDGMDPSSDRCVRGQPP